MKFISFFFPSNFIFQFVVLKNCIVTGELHKSEFLINEDNKPFLTIQAKFQRDE